MEFSVVEWISGNDAFNYSATIIAVFVVLAAIIGAIKNVISGRS